MPVVWSGNHDSVHRTVLQQLPEVPVGFRSAPGIAKRLFQMRLVDIACRDWLGILLRERFLPDLATPVASADNPQSNAFVRPEDLSV